MSWTNHVVCVGIGRLVGAYTQRDGDEVSV